MRGSSERCEKGRDYSRTDLVLIIVVTAVSAFFRLWKIDSVPPGLSSDEADWGFITLSILKGHLYQVSELGTLFSYFASLPVLILGCTPLSLRVGAALSGILTAPLVYLWIYEAFRQRFCRGFIICHKFCLCAH